MSGHSLRFQIATDARPAFLIGGVTSSTACAHGDLRDLLLPAMLSARDRIAAAGTHLARRSSTAYTGLSKTRSSAATYRSRVGGELTRHAPAAGRTGFGICTPHCSVSSAGLDARLFQKDFECTNAKISAACAGPPRAAACSRVRPAQDAVALGRRGLRRGSARRRAPPLAAKLLADTTTTEKGRARSWKRPACAPRRRGYGRRGGDAKAGSGERRRPLMLRGGASRREWLAITARRHVQRSRRDYYSAGKSGEGSRRRGLARTRWSSGTENKSDGMANRGKRGARCSCAAKVSRHFSGCPGTRRSGSSWTRSAFPIAAARRGPERSRPFAGPRRRDEIRLLFAVARGAGRRLELMATGLSEDRRRATSGRRPRGVLAMGAWRLRRNRRASDGPAARSRSMAIARRHLTERSADVISSLMDAQAGEKTR